MGPDDPLELTRPHHVTVGYVGTPGQRIFLFQAEDDDARVTLLLEKGQAAGIGQLLTQLLVQLDDGPATDWDRRAMELRPPAEADWRVGEIGVGIDLESDRFVIELTEVGDEEPSQLRVHLDRDQARRLAAHAAEQVSQGRPTCRLCGRPEGPEGTHVCPATNGHGKLAD